MDHQQLSGAIPALVTPFTADSQAIDFVSLRKLLDHVAARGVKSVVACGSTGEAVALTDAEYGAVIKTVRECFQGTVIAGCGASSTTRTIQLATIARDAGAGALLVVNPPYNKPTAAGLLAHYAAVAQSSGLPIIAYNVPSRTGMNLPVDVVVELAANGIIVGIKESSGSIEQFTELASKVPQDFVLLSGEDSLVLPAMSLGARGVISVAANAVPELIFEITNAFERGDWNVARKAQLAAFPLIKALFSESNPIPIKALLACQGVISSDSLRLPLVPASDSTRQALRAKLEEIAPLLACASG